MLWEINVKKQLLPADPYLDGIIFNEKYLFCKASQQHNVHRISNIVLYPTNCKNRLSMNVLLTHI